MMKLPTFGMFAILALSAGCLSEETRRMDGLTLIREARRLHPGLRTIIITGYSTESSAIEAVNLAVVGYLVKPFRVTQVLSAVARALGESS